MIAEYHNDMKSIEKRIDFLDIIKYTILEGHDEGFYLIYDLPAKKGCKK